MLYGGSWEGAAGCRRAEAGARPRQVLPAAELALPNRLGGRCLFWWQPRPRAGGGAGCGREALSHGGWQWGAPTPALPHARQSPACLAADVALWGPPHLSARM